ncbi:Glucose-6-phosphate dehydrogenase C-terminal domain-containing protein [Phytophthora infestans]|uniref:Glucose-6-phosphate dehydrogenase C-terminal domain-containing protein n=1 Tax=Phytophthora infestans TaxID=4787 RepID=A0A8S9U5Z9_PHYIN|nr:Glucose-6-phosphate dehydrogenase C-terminal domain-containing protein [Phytophthora infestans]
MQCSVALTLLILLFVFEATSQLPHSASPFAVLSQTHANSNTEQVVDVIVIGATGDLATKYLWVAMFRMALEGKMVSRRTFRLFAGASDTLERGRIWHENFFNEKFAERVCGVFEDKMSAEQVYCREFLEVEFKPNVQYAPLRSESHYKELGRILQEEDNLTKGGRIVYLAIPPQFFLPCCEMIHRYLRPNRSETQTASPFLRVVVEKPFGRDLQSAHELATRLRAIYSNDELFVMDHYAGKPVVQALRSYLQLNTATLNPIWNSNYIQDIHIEMTETATLQHRVSYFDSSGIIRDVMVNHLQLLLNVAVAPSFDAAISIHEAQLRFIRSLRVSSRQSLFIAQYDEYAAHYEAEMSQRSDESDHFTPTAAWIELTSSLDEWRDTSFRLAAAKATAERQLSITVAFNSGVFQDQQCTLTVIIQRALNVDASEAHRIEWSCDVSEVLPDLQLPKGWKYVEADDHRVVIPQRSEHATAAWELGDEASAYDFLLREIANGATEHFADLDEVEAAWTLWTPVVHAAEAASNRDNHTSYPAGTSPWKSESLSTKTSQEVKEEL